jgi:hypothetical protein
MITKSGTRSSRRKSKAGSRKHGDSLLAEIMQYRDQYVIIDTASHFIFIGRLQDSSDHFVTLSDADVHDRRESPSMNEKYIIDAKKYGVRCNRKCVHIRLEEVISLSLLDDVIEY